MNALDKYNLSSSISSGNEIPRLLMKPTQLCSIFKDSHDHRCHSGELRRLRTGTSLRAVVRISSNPLRNPGGACVCCPHWYSQQSEPKLEVGDSPDLNLGRQTLEPTVFTLGSGLILGHDIH